ncbi:MAG TPA: Wzz/FepE/Etk N-terminal domain-containing protein, partial [Longimicrobium sp.]|nr:Wzz/FepE/Etk N-terminal domain-containing protein [Longimicrobium sp.]
MSSAQPRPLALVPPENDGLTPLPADAPGDYPDTVDLREVLSVLRRHLALIAVIALLVTGAAAYVVLSQPAEYRASALLRLKDVRGAMTAGLDDAGLKGLLMGRTTDPLLSEIEVLKSRAVATEVVDGGTIRLRFPESFPAELVDGVQVDSAARADTIHVAFSAGGVAARSGGREARAPYGAPVQLDGVRFTVASYPGTPRAEFYVLDRERAISGFMRALSAKPREQTDVVDVWYTAGSPDEAQRVVNNAVSTFQNLNLRLAQEHSRRRRIFIEEQLVGSDSLLAGAQLALSEFRRRENVYSSSQKFAAEQTTLQGLEVRREELVAERDMYASLLGRVGRGTPEPAALNALVSAPGMAGNPV